MIYSLRRTQPIDLCARQQCLRAQAPMVALFHGGVIAVCARRSTRRELTKPGAEVSRRRAIFPRRRAGLETASLFQESTGSRPFKRGTAIGLAAVVSLLLSGLHCKAQDIAQQAWAVNPEIALQWYTAWGWEIKAASLASDAKTLLMVIAKDQHIKICPIVYEAKGNFWRATSGCQRVK